MRRPWLIAALILGLDQATKALIQRAFSPGQTAPLVDGLVSLTYIQNSGAAFGLLRGQQVLFIVLSVAVMGWMVVELLRARTRPGRTGAACALILGGAAGNLIDRVRVGYVIDFLDLHVWPVFNVADSAITIGVCCLILSAWLTRRQPG